MSALLRGHLVFDLDGGNARTHELLYCAVEVHGISVAVINVRDDRKIDCAYHFADLIEHFRHGEQTEIGKSELGVRYARAGRIDRRKAGCGDEPGG